MTKSIEFNFSKEEAVTKLKHIFFNNQISVLEEKIVNNGVGLKFLCKKDNNFGVVAYFKAGRSSKIVLENADSEIFLMFSKSINKDKDDLPLLEIEPISYGINIHNRELQNLIKINFDSNFSEIIYEKPKDTILYKYSITKLNNKFTVTQFNNGTLLLQGLATPLFEEIKEIINKHSPISYDDNAMIYVPEKKQEFVKSAIDSLPEAFEDLVVKSKKFITNDVFDFLFENDKKTLMSAIGILEIIKSTSLDLPLFNPLIYPFSKVYEGFIIKLMVEKCFFTFDQYRENPDIAKIGNLLREKKFEKYIKDRDKNNNILDSMKTTWEELRCGELHTYAGIDLEIVKSEDIQQAEYLIGRIADTIIKAYRILVANGYTEVEMLALRKNTLNNIE